MYKIPPPLSRFVTLMFAILFTLLSGCQPAQEKNTVKVQPRCLAQQSECLVQTPNGDFQVLFNVDKVTPETPFEILVKYQGGKQLKSLGGYLEGRDMFMGKIPLFLTEQSAEQYLGEVMLGSCAQPTMVWRLWLKAEFVKQEPSGESKPLDKQSFFIDFPSSIE